MRLYLGEITSLALAISFCFAAAAVATRYFANRILIRTIRNLSIAIIAGAFATSLVYSILVNQTPRGRVDRSAADQDQKSFEQRHK